MVRVGVRVVVMVRGKLQWPSRKNSRGSGSGRRGRRVRVMGYGFGLA